MSQFKVLAETSENTVITEYKQIMDKNNLNNDRILPGQILEL